MVGIKYRHGHSFFDLDDCVVRIGQSPGQLSCGNGECDAFVAGKDLERNVLIAVQGKNHPLLFTDWLTTSEVFWVNAAPDTPLRCKAKVRYRQDDQDCIIETSGDGFRVTFDKPQRAVTPGQSVVFYLDDLCLGGGIIEATGNN